MGSKNRESQSPSATPTVHGMTHHAEKVRNMDTLLRVLMVSDSQEDAALVIDELQRAEFNTALTRVDDLEAISAALSAKVWDVILADSTLVHLYGSAAFALREQEMLEPPFIVLSGTEVPPEVTATLTGGARDYIPKGDLSRLTQAIESALQETKERAGTDGTEVARRGNETSFANLLDIAADAIVSTDRDMRIVLFNKGAERIFGYRSKEVLGKSLQLLLPPRDTDADNHLKQLFAGSSETPRQTGERWEMHARRQDGSQFPVETSTSQLTQDGQTVFVCILRDITERKQSEERIQRQVRHLSALRAVDAAISSSFDLRVTLSVLLDQVSNTLRVDAAAVLQLDPTAQILGCIAGRGFRTDALVRTPLRLGEGPAGRAARDRRVVHLPNVARRTDQGGHGRMLAEEAFVDCYATPLICKGQVRGVLEVFHRALLDPDEEWLNLFDAFAQQAVIAMEAAGLFEDLQRANAELALAYDTTLEGWARALELRDIETEGHSRRVPAMTLRLARAVGMTEAELVHVRRGALLHDIGKMGIPDGILLKPGPLTAEEWEIMRRHPVYAYEMLMPIDYLRPALDIPYCHHEKWDGTGYPRALKGEQIPLTARLFALVDVWDALRSERPYKPAWPEEEMRDYIRSMAGSHFDPEVTELFLRTELHESGQS